MKIDEFDFPDDLYYHKEHTWAKVSGDVVIVGLNDFAQKLAGSIKTIRLLDTDEEVTQSQAAGSISSGKWSGKIYSPISGEISEVNEILEDEPNKVNQDPYGEGWLFKVRNYKESELNNLMRPCAEFETWIRQQIKEKKELIEKK